MALTDTTRTACNLLSILGILAGGYAAPAATLDPAAIRPERVDAIAAMLPDKPVGLGRPITDRPAWEAVAKQPGWDTAIAEAEKVAAEPIPEQPDDLYLDYSRTGNRTRWQDVAGQRRARIKTLVLGECLENKGRFLPALEETLRQLCRERTWVGPAHDSTLRNFNGTQIDVDLFSVAVAWSLATTDYLLGDRLSTDTRQLIRDKLDERIFTPFRAMIEGKQDRNWWIVGTNNWNAVCLAGVTGTALATLDSPRDRAFFVAAAEHYVQNFLSGFSSDGYCSEGLSYWNYGFGNYVLLAETIAQATSGKIDLLLRPEARAPATYAGRVEIMNSLYPTFADCPLDAKPADHLMAFLNRRLHLGWPQWEQATPPSPKEFLPSVALYTFPNSASRTPPTSAPARAPEARTFFDQAGILICRPGQHTDCKIAVAMKGGNNAEHHNHNDVGSFLVVLGKQAVLTDPGSEVYTRRTFSKDRYVSQVLNSFGHSVPTVGDRLQRTGRNAQGKILRSEFTDMTDTLALDISSAYELPGLQKLERTFVYSRQKPGSLTVTDEVVMEKPEAFETALITFGQANRLDDNTLVIRDGQETLLVDIQTFGQAFEIKSAVLREDLHSKQYPNRLGIRLTEPVTKARIVLTIRPLILPEVGADK